MFSISVVSVRAGEVGLCPIPGRRGSYEDDLTVILNWRPDLVLTMVTGFELSHVGADTFGIDLEAAGIGWRHLPVGDFGAPSPETAALWPEASGEAHRILEAGGKVLTHCFGGCGRAGMSALRLMVEAGENADPALERLREARACAVEAEGQRAWAAIPMYERLGWSP